ncbi:hypothetical protein HOD38_01300 [archaeon]|jgi:hypothetical protein|nr:hypothetical protein [archaeon]MBT4396881.1 hypothetical protein [archaeon]MBT4441441.1 hypothetical protein [archaeon]
MKKGQMEILGFMVIILLIIMGIIFYIKFMPDDSGTSSIQETEMHLEVSNMLDVIRLQTVCESTQMDDVIKTCMSGGFECGQDACELMQEQMALITNTYGWEEGVYMFYIDNTLYTEECIGDIIPDDATISGKKVKLWYCNP